MAEMKVSTAKTDDQQTWRGYCMENDKADYNIRVAFFGATAAMPEVPLRDA
jgi:hypothetical protein